MRKFTIPHGTKCEFEMYDCNDSLFEIHRNTNFGVIIFYETQLIEESSFIGCEGKFMRFGGRKKDTMTDDDFYEYVVVDTKNIVIENI